MNIRKMRFFPQSRKARAWLAVFAFAALAAGFFLIPGKPPQKAQTPSALARGDEERLTQLNRDDDNDGLKNWEEALFRANPNNPDTDKDGVSDGEEVKQGRDPAKTGPDDKLSNQEIKATKTIEPAQVNLTQRVAELFGSKYLARRATNPSTPLDIESLSEEIANASLAQPSGSVKLFTERDLAIEATPLTKSSINSYLTQFNETVRTNLPPDGRNPETVLAVFRHALEEEQYAGLIRFDEYLKGYEGFFAQATRLSVPEALAPLHLNYLNTAAREQGALKKMRSAETDVLGSLVGAREYAAAAEEFQQILETFQRLYQSAQLAQSP